MLIERTVTDKNLSFFSFQEVSGKQCEYKMLKSECLDHVRTFKFKEISGGMNCPKRDSMFVKCGTKSKTDNHKR